MSQPTQQPQSFSQINMNAIKNTKLFQKFMQNKSGLMAGNSNSNASLLVNKTVQVKRQQENTDGNISGNHSKSTANSKINSREQSNGRKMVVNLKKDHTINPIKQVQKNINTQNSDIQHHNSSSQHHNQKPHNSYQQLQDQQQPKNTINKSPHQYNQHYQQSFVEPYQKNRQSDIVNEYNQYKKPKPHQLQQQELGIEQQFGNTSNTQTNGNVQKRKRNFNGYNNIEKNYEPTRNSYPVQQSYLIQQSYNTNSVSQNVYSESVRQNVSLRNHKSNSNNPSYTIPQKPAQNSFNYSTSYQTNQQEKYAKIQSSPGRSNTYSHNYNMPLQKHIPQQTYNEPAHQQNSHPASTSIPYSQQEYKQKYDQLQKKYDELKQQVKNDSRHRKKQFSEWQHEIQLLKEKLFDVQSRQDSLLIQNQRLKEKCEGQNLSKMKTQQENKESTFRIKELQDQLQMKESAIKQKSDETSYWKTQVDAMKQQLNIVRLGLEKKIDQYNLLFGDYQIVRKQRDNKDYLLDDLRRSINSLVQENSAAKDEIFKLVTKLYQMEQQNQIIRNDLKRQQLDTSQIHNYMKDLKEQNSHISRERVQSSYVERERQPQQNIYEPHMNMMERSSNGQQKNDNNGQQRNEMGYRNDGQQNRQQLGRGSLTEQEQYNVEKPTRKRGEFARQRGQVTRNQKPQRDQRPLPARQNPQHHKSITQDRTFSTTNNQPPINKPQTFIPTKNNNKMARIQQVCQELQKIKDMKAMNGAIRRRRIDLERELQELEDKIN